jgi:hypothetical protein
MLLSAFWYSNVATTTFLDEVSLPLALPLAFFGGGPASVVHAVLKSTPSRCSTSWMTSPPIPQPRQLKICFLALTAKRSSPPHFGQAPTRSRPSRRSLKPRRSISCSKGTARARRTQSLNSCPSWGHLFQNGISSSMSPGLPSASLGFFFLIDGETGRTRTAS